MLMSYTKWVRLQNAPLMRAVGSRCRRADSLSLKLCPTPTKTHRSQKNTLLRSRIQFLRELGRNRKFPPFFTHHKPPETLQQTSPNPRIQINKRIRIQKSRESFNLPETREKCGSKIRITRVKERDRNRIVRFTSIPRRRSSLKQYREVVKKYKRILPKPSVAAAAGSIAGAVRARARQPARLDTVAICRPHHDLNTGRRPAPQTPAAVVTAAPRISAGAQKVGLMAGCLPLDLPKLIRIGVFSRRVTGLFGVNVAFNGHLYKVYPLLQTRI